MKLSHKKSDNKKLSLLWVQFIDGDMDAFKTIYNNHYQSLFNFGSRYLNPSEVKDCIHDTFLSILNYKNKSSDVKDVKSYLFRCLRNQIFKIKQNTKIEFSFIEGTIPAKNKDKNNEPILKEVKKLIEQLSPREREIVYLKYFQEFTNFEIAESLDIKYQTVRNILTGAIKKLRVLGDDFTHLLFLLFKNKKTEKINFPSF